MEIPQEIVKIAENTVKELIVDQDVSQVGNSLGDRLGDALTEISEHSIAKASQAIDQVIARLTQDVESHLPSLSPEVAKFTKSLLGDLLSGKSSALQPESILSSLANLVLSYASQALNLQPDTLPLQQIITTVLTGIQQDAVRKAALQRISDGLDKEINRFLSDRPQPHIAFFDNLKR